MAKIGVFDSGIGGLSVVRAIKKEMPGHRIIFKNDAEHVPYGTRSIEEIYGFTKPIIRQLVDEGCDVIVIACNTVTTNLISRLREDFDAPFIGMEPMVKPAAEASLSGIIAVCATPRTLQSKRYDWLKQKFAPGVNVLEPDCSDWMLMIESNKLDREKIAKTIGEVCEAGADQIVLGCTHFHWIEELIKQAADGRAKVLQPETPVITQLNSVLQQLGRAL
ncbi:MAG: putative Glutamate racemase [Candidatus Saccharibacteria bacterium]|nr:putative Glutamate racemase [Candidatus Saccharibacteria bacterium]